MEWSGGRGGGGEGLRNAQTSRRKMPLQIGPCNFFNIAICPAGWRVANPHRQV